LSEARGASLDVRRGGPLAESHRTLPPIALLLALRRYVAASPTMGGVKG
jgi:hypothetical protein